MVYIDRNNRTNLRLNEVYVASGSRSNFSVNSAYVNLTSGAAMGCRLRCRTNEPINEIYLLLDATTGTRGNVSMVANVRGIAATLTQPTATLLATSSAAALPASDDQWIRFVFPSPYTPARGEWLFITFQNTASAPATDFPGILNASAMEIPAVGSEFLGYSTANGFSTAGTSVSEMGIVFVQGSSTVYGNPWSLSGTVTTFTGKRGCLFGPEIKDYRVRWARVGNSSSGTRNFQIYDLATPPSGSPLLDFAVNGNEDRSIGLGEVDWDLSTLPGNGPFVFCLSLNASLSMVGPIMIEGYSDYPAIFDKFTEQNFLTAPNVVETAGNWVVDRSRTGGIWLEVSDVATVGGGGGLILPRSMNGGY